MAKKEKKSTEKKSSEKKNTKKDTPKDVDSSHKFGWLALFALLSIVGVAVWFVMNSDDVI
jgi:hypothetical protein